MAELVSIESLGKEQLLSLIYNNDLINVDLKEQNIGCPICGPEKAMYWCECEACKEKPKSNVISLIDADQDSKKWSPEDAVRDALDAIVKAEMAFAGNKLLVLALDTRNGAYDISYRNAGMSASQIIALMRVVERIMIEDMGY